MPRLNKSELIQHLTRPHGHLTNATPVTELNRWSFRDLQKEHERLIKIGGCPMVKA